MKKFLVFCVSIIVTVSLGFMVYYFTLNNEGISVGQTSYQMNIDDTASIELERVNPKGDTKISYAFEEDGIVELNEENLTLKAVGEGATRLVITASNKDIAPIYIDFYVGGGSKAYPFYIRNQADLANIGKVGSKFKLDSNYKLVNDIAILGNDNWKSIGSNGTSAPTDTFTGTFDGQGNTISNLKLNSDLYAGLFAQVGNKGSVNNLVLSNVTIGGNCAFGGAVAGVNNGTIKDCYVISGSITSTNPGANLGGIAGANESLSSIASIYKCMTNVEISSVNADIVGGITGANKGAEVNYCYTDLGTSITATQDGIVGGIAGKNTYSATYAGAVAGCYVLGTFNGANNNVHGGIVGVNDYNDSTATSEKTNKIFGNYYVVDSFVKGVGNYEDVENASTTPNADYGIYGVESKTYGELCTQATFKLLRNAKTDAVVAWNFTDVWTMAASGTPKFNKEGSFVPNNRGLLIQPGEVNTLSQLMSIKSGDSVEIAEDIDLEGMEWNALNLANITMYGSEEFKEANGRYPSIYNFKIKNGEYVGFFGTLENSLIENLNFEKVSNVNNEFVANDGLYMGIIAGFIDASTVLNNVTTSNQVSTGYANTLTANISSNFEGKTVYVGGLVGASNGVINNSKSDSVTVTITYSSGVKATAYVGGVTGALLNANAVEKSNAIAFNASVTSGKDGAVGGIVGMQNENTLVSNCFVQNSNITTDVAYNGDSSGLVGHYEGGITGNVAEGARISGSAVNNANIQGFFVGGIVGRVAGNVNNCYTRANVTAYKAGGVAGYQTRGTIANVRVDGSLANPINDISYDLGTSELFSRSSQKAGVVCISYGTQDNTPRFENVFVNCSFANDNHDSYITTATKKDNKNYSSIKAVYSGEEDNIVYNSSVCGNVGDRDIISGFAPVDAVLDFFQGSTKVYSYSTNDSDMQNGDYDEFTRHNFTVENWSFSGRPTVKCVNENIQNA